MQEKYFQFSRQAFNFLRRKFVVFLQIEITQHSRLIDFIHQLFCNRKASQAKLKTNFLVRFWNAVFRYHSTTNIIKESQFKIKFAKTSQFLPVNLGSVQKPAAPLEIFPHKFKWGI